MKWESLELHIEHLFPGVLVLYLMFVLFGGSLVPVLPRTGTTSDSFLAVAVFLSAAYVLGVIAALVSRMLLDWLSDRCFTKWWFRAVARRMFGADLGSRVDVLRDYDEALASATVSTNDGYRNSVARRRERAGLVRTCFIPLVLVAALSLRRAVDWSVPAVIVAGLLIALIVMLPLFGYAESLIYNECLKERTRVPVLKHEQPARALNG